MHRKCRGTYPICLDWWYLEWKSVADISFHPRSMQGGILVHLREVVTHVPARYMVDTSNPSLLNLQAIANLPKIASMLSIVGEKRYLRYILANWSDRHEWYLDTQMDCKCIHSSVHILMKVWFQFNFWAAFGEFSSCSRENTSCTTTYILDCPLMLQ